LNLDLRDVGEISVVRENNKAVPDADRRDPDTHDARPAPGDSSVANDRGEGS
jgi:hypothetical protein